MEKKVFDLHIYLKTVEEKIREIFQRPCQETMLCFDLLDTEKSRRNKVIVLRDKQRQMKIGEVWQEVLGNYDGFENLKIGHQTGLDIISHSKKIVVEIKNRTNTDNASSRKANLDKLAEFKRANMNYVCIYANINASTEEKTKKGYKKLIIHQGVEIEIQVGFVFLNFIMGNDALVIIDKIKECIDKYSENC